MIEIKITDTSWDGIFLNEDEAAKALAFGQLPERILEHYRVPRDTRERAASDPAEKRSILLVGKLDIARWESWDAGEAEPLRDGTIHLELYRTGTFKKETNQVIKALRVCGQGRSYSMAEEKVLIEMHQIAYRLMVAAEFAMENRLLAKRITENK